MDAVWDRGALVAIEPSLRGRYASLVAERMAPGARMLVVAVSYDPEAGVKARVFLVGGGWGVVEGG